VRAVLPLPQQQGQSNGLYYPRAPFHFQPVLAKLAASQGITPTTQHSHSNASADTASDSATTTGREVATYTDTDAVRGTAAGTAQGGPAAASPQLTEHGGAGDSSSSVGGLMPWGEPWLVKVMEVMAKSTDNHYTSTSGFQVRVGLWVWVWEEDV